MGVVDDGGDADMAAVTAQRSRHGLSDSICNGDAPNMLTPLGLGVDVVGEMDVDTVDMESWIASLRPSPDDLNAGGAFIGSDELKEHASMLRVIGEFSASQMLSEKAGACPGADAATDAAWTYLEEKFDRFGGLVAGAVAAAPPERKDDVHLIKWLVSPLGLQYLRAFARELRRATTASPHAAVTDVVTDGAPVNWSACWAWYVQHSTTLSGLHSSHAVPLSTAWCVAGTVTSWRCPSARCTWLGVRCSALSARWLSPATWRRTGRQSALSICTPTTLRTAQSLGSASTRACTGAAKSA